MDTYMKVDTAAIYKMQGELSRILNRAYNAVNSMAEGIAKTDSFLVCQGVYKIKNKSDSALAEAKKVFSRMNMHIIKLSDIARIYENAERSNLDGID